MAESSSGSLLNIVNLRVVYNGAVVALTHVDLEVRRQDFVALLGANGAGKTTVLRAVSSLLQADRGQARADVARFDGADILELGACAASSDAATCRALDGRIGCRDL